MAAQDQNQNQNNLSSGFQPPAVGSADVPPPPPPVVPPPVSPPGQAEPAQPTTKPAAPMPNVALGASPSQQVKSGPISPVTPVVKEPEKPGGDEVVAATPPKKGFPKTLVLIMGILLLLGAIGAGIFIFGKDLLNLGGGGSEETEIVWWGLWEDDTIVNSLISEYESQNPGVTVRYERQSKQDYRERLTNALARKEGPDIFRIHNTWVPMFSKELDTLPASVMSAAEYSETFFPVTVSDMTSGSGLVGMPLGFDALVLYINDDIFESYGKTPPDTWDELRETALELTVRDEQGVIKQAGVALGRTENVDHWQEILALMMIQNGVRMSKPTGKPAEDALQFYTLFSSFDRVWDETQPPSTIAFSSGKLAMYFGPSWRAFEISLQNPELRYTAVPVPQLPKDSPDQPDIGYATYWVEAVSKQSEVKDQAWQFLKFMSSKESLEKFYQSASNTRLFGEPYPRRDMVSEIEGESVPKAVVSQGLSAKSWYLASRTFDGPTGINTQISKYFEDGINAILDNEQPADVLETISSGVSQVLSQYGLVSR